MKKFYEVPEMEVLETEIEVILAGSTESEDITDGPTPTIEDPSDEDLDW